MWMHSKWMNTIYHCRILRLRYVSLSSTCQLSEIPHPLLSFSFWLVFPGWKPSTPGSPFPSAFFMQLLSQETAWFSLPSSLSPASTSPCIISCPCFPPLTSACLYPLWSPCWVSSGSMPGRSALMPACHKCFSFNFSLSWNLQCCWPWPLIYLWLSLILLDMPVS